MSAPIGPGDLVVCVIDGAADEGWTPLTLGRIYTVATTQAGWDFDANCAVPCLSLHEVPDPPQCPDGFWIGLFSRVDRPKSSIIESLKQPAPDAVRELIAAD